MAFCCTPERAKGETVAKEDVVHRRSDRKRTEQKEDFDDGDWDLDQFEDDHPQEDMHTTLQQMKKSLKFNRTSTENILKQVQESHEALITRQETQVKQFLEDLRTQLNDSLEPLGAGSSRKSLSARKSMAAGSASPRNIMDIPGSPGKADSPKKADSSKVGFSKGSDSSSEEDNDASGKKSNRSKDAKKGKQRSPSPSKSQKSHTPKSNKSGHHSFNVNTKKLPPVKTDIEEPEVQSPVVNAAPTNDLEQGKKNKSMARKSFAEQMKEIEEIEEQTRIARIARGDTFRAFTTVLILTNAVFIAMQTQYAADNLDTDQEPAYYITIDACFCVVFTFELLFRVAAERIGFFVGSDKWWNIFDLVLVIIAINDQIASIMMIASGGPPIESEQEKKEDGGNFTFMRVLRLFRVLRVVRLFKFCPQLSLMLNEIMEAMTAVVWLFVLLGVILFILSLVFMTATTQFLKGSGGSPELRADMTSWFGTLPQALLSLFKAMSVGLLWEQIGDGLWEVHMFYGFMFLGYIGFAVFGAANVVTGVFVESAQETQKKEKMAFIELMRRAIHTMDKGEKGYVTRLEFSTALDDGILTEYLNSHGLDTQDAQRAFDMMDGNQEQFLQMGRLSDGLIKLVEDTRGSDLVLLRLENRRLSKEFHDFCCFTEMKLRELGARHGAQRYFAKRADEH